MSILPRLQTVPFEVNQFYSCPPLSGGMRDKDMEEGMGGQDMATGTIVVDIGGTEKGLTVIMNESRQLGAR